MDACGREGKLRKKCCACMQAPAMSQALLCQAAPWQDPTDWLGLLISLRKYWAHQWVRCRAPKGACLAKPMSAANRAYSGRQPEAHFR
jgi:hypothetical protein